MIFSLAQPIVWDCLIVGIFWLHHIQSLANVTMATIVYCRAKRPKGIAVGVCTKGVAIVEGNV
jgi:hypothetical protein